MAGRPRKFAKELTTDERTMLETIAHSRTEEKRRVERAEVILGCAAGMSNVAIAEKLHISKPTVVKVLKNGQCLALTQHSKIYNGPVVQPRFELKQKRGSSLWLVPSPRISQVPL